MNYFKISPFNLALRAARAPFFKWSSSNDLHHPEFLQVCINALEQQSDAVLAYTRTKLFVDALEDAVAYEEQLGLDADDPWERFLRFLDRIQLNNVMNGVFRTAHLRLGSPIKSIIGADLVVTAAMTLHGKFIEVPGAFSYRRMDEASATRLRGDAAIREHYDPGRARRMLFQLWRLKLDYLSAVIAAPMPVMAKLSLGATLLRRMAWSRQALLHDALVSVKSLVKQKAS